MTRPAGEGRRRLAGPIAVMLATDLAMALADALVKSVSADLSLWQIYVLRSLLALPLTVLPVLLAGRGGALRPRSARWVALRCLLLMAMWIAFYAALSGASLAAVAACYYTAPLFVILLSRLLTGEPVPPLRWLAIGLGFAGVLVTLRPAQAGFSWSALPAVAAAALYALAAIVTRAKCPTESPLLLSAAMNLGFLAVGLAGSAASWAWAGSLAGASGAGHAFLLAGWAPIGLREWGLLAALAVLIVAVTTGVARAYQAGPPTVIAAVDYSYLVFAALWGFVLLGERPDRTGLVGLGLIILAGGAALAAPPGRPARRLLGAG